MSHLVIALIYVVIFGGIGAAFSPRGRGRSGFYLGVLFGPIGWLIAALQRPATPSVEEEAQWRAKVEMRTREIIEEESRRQEYETRVARERAQRPQRDKSSQQLDGDMADFLAWRMEQQSPD